MGCDIHLYTEKRNAETGQWEPVNGNGGNLYDGSSYNLFAILADVRNGRGFGGVKTGEGFVPISDPRGTPEDASDAAKEFMDSYGSDGHSHSYHTLRQLLEYDWTQQTQLQGYVRMKEWVHWSRWNREHGPGPEEWCGDVSGPGVVKLSAEEMDALSAETEKLDRNQVNAWLLQHANTYGKAKWSIPYYRASANFMSETIPQLLALAGGPDGVDDVRILFFFDN